MARSWFAFVLVCLASCGTTGEPAARGEQVTLVVGVLTIESSYSGNVEREHRGVPDTIQWWVAPDNAWRIRTFAIDHDIHTHVLGNTDTDLVAYATDSTRRIYGDVLAAIYVLRLDRGSPESLQKAVAAAKLAPYQDFSPRGFGFWKPDDARYWSQSEPK